MEYITNKKKAVITGVEILCSTFYFLFLQYTRPLDNVLDLYTLLSNWGGQQSHFMMSLVDEVASCE
jgi:hypothetical protein